MNAAHDLSFISYQGPHCGLSSCNRDVSHFHCRICGFGTSQIGNAMTHGRNCLPLEVPQKDFVTNIPTCSDVMYSSTTQHFSYFTQSNQCNMSNSIVPNQQNGMFNFVLPSQSSQYSSLYGPQTVFPNPSLFSPSNFNNFTQLDSTWMSQKSYNVLPGINTPTPELGGRASDSPNCCRTDNQSLCLTPPLMLDSCKVTSKDSQSQNWYSQNVVNQPKYPELTASSCSISLLFLGQNSDDEECINVEDLCLTPKTEDQPRSSCMQADNKEEISCSSSDMSDIVVEESDTESSEANEEPLSRCSICSSAPAASKFLKIDEKAPSTVSNRASVLSKLANILEMKYCENIVICSKCLDLTNMVDSLESKLSSAIKELKDVYENGQRHSLKSTVAVETLEDAFVCSSCHKPFPSLTLLEKHEQYHNKSFDFCCEYCGRGFNDIKKLESHISLHSKTLRYQCELCGKQFIEKHVLTNHIRKHKGDYRYNCSFCLKGFMHKSVYQTHMNVHNGEFFVCHHCGKRVKTHSNLVVHMKVCSGNLKYDCEKCSKKFPIRSLLEKHVSIEHKREFRYSCSICSKRFWKESDLKSHERIHTGKKPYACSICGKSYKTKTNLNQHMKVHGDNTFLQCSVCGKGFTRMDVLTDHFNQHTGRKPYQCRKCGAQFANRINYNVHCKRHITGKGNVKCTICHKVIDGQLEEHMLAHANKKEFACRDCPASFAFKNSLVKHVKLKHGAFKENKIS